MTDERLIEVSDVAFSYPDGTLALRNINLDIYANQFIAFIGQNGSGKTTIAKCLNGLLKPNSGYVKINNLDTREKGATKKIVTKVGYVFKTPIISCSTIPSTKKSLTGRATLGWAKKKWMSECAKLQMCAGSKKAYSKSIHSS